jgi:hypothetical protein
MRAQTTSNLSIIKLLVCEQVRWYAAASIRGAAMRKRAAMYLRVSTDGQTTENQRIALEEVTAKAGWQIVGVYQDAGFSGAKGREKRPEFWPSAGEGGDAREGPDGARQGA